MKLRVLILGLLFAVLSPASSVLAQGTGLSVGPQLSTLGIGASAAYRLQPKVSLSAEVGFYPGEEGTWQSFGNRFEGGYDVLGGLALVNFHPFGGGFSIGIGALVGGYRGDGTGTLVDGVIDVGDNTYDTNDIGLLTATARATGPAPALVLGLRGAGLNFGLGVVITGAPTIELTADGPVGSTAQFRADVDRELEDVRSDLDRIPALPYVRLGWQFGL